MIKKIRALVQSKHQEKSRNMRIPSEISIQSDIQSTHKTIIGNTIPDKIHIDIQYSIRYKKNYHSVSVTGSDEMLMSSMVSTF